MAKKIVIIQGAPFRTYKPKRRPKCRAGRTRCGSICLRSDAECRIFEWGGKTYRPVYGKKGNPHCFKGIRCGNACARSWAKCRKPAPAGYLSYAPRPKARARKSDALILPSGRIDYRALQKREKELFG